MTCVHVALWAGLLACHHPLLFSFPVSQWLVNSIVRPTVAGAAPELIDKAIAPDFPFHPGSKDRRAPKTGRMLAAECGQVQICN
jgi:hypothetical protein